jgi:hypothetical protein
MVSKKQRKEMLDYLVTRLESSASNVKPISLEFYSGIKTNLVKVDNDGAVLLVDQKYKNGILKPIYRDLIGQVERLAVVFYKDGRTFFRSAAQDKRWKSQKGLSLKNYDEEEMNRVIMFRPEESLIFGQNNGILQYYQPQSQKLSQGVVSLEFTPVRFDYSHIPSSSRFKPENRDSDKLYIWERKHEHIGDLTLVRRYVRSR